jgi:type II secretory pathway predicted ATPase ExeA
MNYDAFFALKDKPFRQSPDTDYYFSSHVHKELMHHLLYCIKADDAFVEITSEPGIGKTITVRCFLNQVADDNVKISFILNPKITPQDLLNSIAIDCGMDENIIEKSSGEKIFRMFHEHLKALNHKKIVPIVIIDDAHSLSNESLENLCLISNLETDKKSLIKIILLGQPLLHQRLQSPVLQKIDNRISIRFYLSPLSKLDTANYIYHRLGIASAPDAPPSIFSEQIINQIYKYSKGVPRLINIICDRTLMAAFSENRRDIQSKHVKKAYKSFQGNQKISSHVKKKRFLVVSIALLFFISCIYMTANLINFSSTPETKTESLVPEQTAVLSQQSDITAKNTAALTQTNINKISKMASQTSNTPEKKQNEKSLQIPLKTPEKSENQQGQNIQNIDMEKLLTKKLFTKNSYCIVVSPDINRIVVWQGKPDSAGLTSSRSDDLFKLDETVSFMNKQFLQTYTSSSSDALPSTQNNTSTDKHSSSIQNIATAIKPLTSVQNTANAIQSLTSKQKQKSDKDKNTIRLAQTTLQTNSQRPFTENAPSHSLNQSKNITISTNENVSAKKAEMNSQEKLMMKPKDQAKNLHQTAPKKKDHAQQAIQKKTPQPQPQPQPQSQPQDQLQDKKSQKKEKQNVILKEVISLPSDKRLALISMDVKQLTVWKGTKDLPRLIKQEKLEFTGSEGIYILCKHKNTQILFNPNVKNQISNKIVHELWKKIDPITNVTPVIVLRSSQKKYGDHTRKLLSFVSRWESAWGQRNLDSFMQMYVNDLIFFYKLDAPPIKLNWKILKSSQSRIFSGNRHKIMHISPVTYLMDPSNPNFATALFNQTFSDANYSEMGVMVFYLKYTQINNIKDWHIYGRLRVY